MAVRNYSTCLSAVPRRLQTLHSSIRLVLLPEQPSTMDFPNVLIEVPMSDVIQTLNNPGGTPPPPSHCHSDLHWAHSPNSQSSLALTKNHLLHLEHHDGERQKETKGLQDAVDDIMEGMDAKMVGLEGKVTGLKGEVTGLKGEVTDLKGEVSSLKDEVKNLKDAILQFLAAK